MDREFGSCPCNPLQFQMSFILRARSLVVARVLYTYQGEPRVAKETEAGPRENGDPEHTSY